MKLYNQLSMDEHNGAIEYCVEIIISDIISGDLKLGTDDEADMPDEMLKGNKIIETAMKKIEKLDLEKDKVDYIVSNDALMNIIYSLAHTMVSGFYFMEPGDQVMFYDDYSPHNEELCEECQNEKDMEALPELPNDTDTLTKNKKHKHSVN